jgi:ribosome-associated protein
MIAITDSIAVDERDLQWEFVRASGPGGQHVNKVSTAVVLRFDAAGATCLPEAVRKRLKQLAGRKMTADGQLVIRADRFRSQLKNRQDAVERLKRLLQRAAVKPKPRRRTKPTLAARERRLAVKQRRSRIKQLRGRVTPRSHQ